MADITMSLDDTLKLDTIVKESTGCVGRVPRGLTPSTLR